MHTAEILSALNKEKEHLLKQYGENGGINNSGRKF